VSVASQGELATSPSGRALGRPSPWSGVRDSGPFSGPFDATHLVVGHSCLPGWESCHAVVAPMPRQRAVVVGRRGDPPFFRSDLAQPEPLGESHSEAWSPPLTTCPPEPEQPPSTPDSAFPLHPRSGGTDPPKRLPIEADLLPHRPDPARTGARLGRQPVRCLDRQRRSSGGLLHELVTSDLWCREALLEGC
jgi:hypothetical protein